MGDTQTTSSQDQSEQTPPEGQEQQPGQQAGGTTFEPITSQEEFDSRIAARLQREKAKFSDYDQLKQRAAGFNQAVEEAKKQGKQEAQEAYHAQLLSSAVRVAAMSQGFYDPEDALAQFGTVEDAIKDGNVDSSKINARLSEIATNKPYLVDAAKAPRVQGTPKIKQSQKSSSTSDQDGKPGPGRAAEALRNFSRNL